MPKSCVLRGKKQPYSLHFSQHTHLTSTRTQILRAHNCELQPPLFQKYINIWYLKNIKNYTVYGAIKQTTKYKTVISINPSQAIRKKCPLLMIFTSIQIYLNFWSAKFVADVTSIWTTISNNSHKLYCSLLRIYNLLTSKIKSTCTQGLFPMVISTEKMWLIYWCPHLILWMLQPILWNYY